MQTRRSTSRLAARLLPFALMLAASMLDARLDARAALAQGAPPPASLPAPRPEAFRPSESPLVVPPAPAPSVAGPQVAPQYPANYPPPGSYGSYPPPAGYPYAQRLGPQPRVGAYEHDGFFLRLSLGVGAGGMRYGERADPNVGPAKVKTRGVAGVFEVAVGGRVVDNLILHGTLIAAGMSSYRTVDGVENRNYDDLATRMVLLGGGVTYYVMPANLFLTTSVGATYLEEEREDQRIGRDDRTRIESDVGVGVSLGVGKEWWVGPRGQWGIGAAITGVFYTAPIEIVATESWAKAHSISISFSATYN